jgi:hypothetical protein
MKNKVSVCSIVPMGYVNTLFKVELSDRELIIYASNYIDVADTSDSAIAKIEDIVRHLVEDRSNVNNQIINVQDLRLY